MKNIYTGLYLTYQKHLIRFLFFKLETVELFLSATKLNDIYLTNSYKQLRNIGVYCSLQQVS